MAEIKNWIGGFNRKVDTVEESTRKLPIGQ